VSTIVIRGLGSAGVLTRIAIRIRIAIIMTITVAMIAMVAVIRAAAVEAPLAAAARLEAEARVVVGPRAADRAAVLRPKVAVKRTPSLRTLERPGKTPLEKECSPEQEPMTLFGGSFYLFESKDFVGTNCVERSILLIRRSGFVYTQ
jgi:hypothetical protein